MWEELARMKEVDRPGAALKAACRAALASVLVNVSGQNVEGLVAGLKEHGSIFVSEVPENHRHPIIFEADEGQEPTLFVEGEPCMVLGSKSPEDHLLAWGLSFAVFGQKLTYPAVKNTAALMVVFILQTDTLVKLPRDLASQMTRLLPLKDVVFE